jgi:hypothetical protein
MSVTSSLDLCTEGAEYMSLCYHAWSGVVELLVELLVKASSFASQAPHSEEPNAYLGVDLCPALVYQVRV